LVSNPHLKVLLFNPESQSCPEKILVIPVFDKYCNYLICFRFGESSKASGAAQLVRATPVFPA